MTISRRRFLKGAVLASGAALLPGGLDALFSRMAHGANRRAGGYGPLLPDPAKLIDLPQGFQYRALSTALRGSDSDPRFSQRLDNGEPVPALHDGMAAFAGPAGLTILVRNHEIAPGDGPVVDPAKSRRYDPLGGGGTTTLWVDANRRLVRSFPSLAGTFRNCAGGPTPWGSWLSAEECTYVPGPSDPKIHDQRPDVGARHGYLFEVDSRALSLVDPVPIRPMGRFYHEAVAVDRSTGFVYLTEDRDDGLLYRYRPDVITRKLRRPGQLRIGDLAAGGVLEALRVSRRPGALTQNWDPAGAAFVPGDVQAVDWVPIEDPDPDVDMERDPGDPAADPLLRRARTAASSTRAQGFRLGAAQFGRGEGIAFDRSRIFFCATSGGAAKSGQVWRLEPMAGTLSLMLEPNDRSLLDGPDNLTPAPNGDLIVCEDGRDQNFVVGITPAGALYHFARNAHNESEFAGACFAPDGRTLFVNLQDPGITFGIWGPWGRRRG